MKIDDYSIQMSSQHSYVEQDIQKENLQAWVDNQSKGQGKANLTFTDSQGAVVDISDLARQLLDGSQAAQQSSATQPGRFELSEADKRKIELIQTFIERLTGKKFKFVIPDVSGVMEKKLSLPAAGSQRSGWGLRYEAVQSHFEQEKVAYSADGIVKTADGREINFSVAMNLSRQFMSERRINIKAGDAAIDPLVINYAGPAAELTQSKYEFDLDSDGAAERISFVKPGSGFLALDLNKDGAINDGRELFGPNSGNGFQELAQYDVDGNNWIDENDPVYQDLRIWSKDENGKDVLLAIGQMGVGAIFLGNVSTSFAMKDNSQQLQGQLQSSGVFLREDGTAGIMQQIDLAV